jgi:serine/threonine-protein phosphatase 2A regulatory subunit B'
MLSLPLKLNRKSAESSSKSKEQKSTNHASSSSNPAPPINTSKPLPPAGTNAANLSNHSSGTHHLVPQTFPFSIRPTSTSSSGSHAPDRRYTNTENGSPAPPIVVVSSDHSSETPPRPGQLASSERHNLGVDHSMGAGVPPRAIAGSRLRAAPKDTIPIVGKPPRKQRSSRFVVTEKVDIERLPPFMGTSTFPPAEYQTPTLIASTFAQRHHRANAPIFSSKNFTNVASYSISTTLARSSRASKSKPRHYMKCWTT